MTKEIKGLFIYVQFLYGTHLIGKYFLINYVLHLQYMRAFTREKSGIKNYSKVCNYVES